MKSKGFTLIELMITLAIVGILLAIAIPAWKNRDNPNIVRTYNGSVATTCVNGFAYTIDRNGNAAQQFNHRGYGVMCSTE